MTSNKDVRAWLELIKDEKKKKLLEFDASITAVATEMQVLATRLKGLQEGKSWWESSPPYLVAEELESRKRQVDQQRSIGEWVPGDAVIDLMELGYQHQKDRVPLQVHGVSPLVMCAAAAAALCIEKSETAEAVMRACAAELIGALWWKEHPWWMPWNRPVDLGYCAPRAKAFLIEAIVETSKKYRIQLNGIDAGFARNRLALGIVWACSSYRTAIDWEQTAPKISDSIAGDNRLS